LYEVSTNVGVVITSDSRERPHPCPDASGFAGILPALYPLATASGCVSVSIAKVICAGF